MTARCAWMMRIDGNQLQQLNTSVPMACILYRIQSRLLLGKSCAFSHLPHCLECMILVGCLHLSGTNAPALFTSSGPTNLTSRGVQPSLQCTASLYLSSLRFDSSFLDSLCALCWNALAEACPFDLGSLCVGVVLFEPVSPGFWPEGA